jgi:hypothetical protein
MSQFRRLIAGAQASLVAKLHARARTLGTIMPAVAAAGLGMAWVLSSTSPTAIKVKVEPLAFASQAAPEFAPAAMAATAPPPVQPIAQPLAQPLPQSLPELRTAEPQAVQPTVGPLPRLPRELERFAKRAAEPVEPLPEIATRKAVAPSVAVADAPKPAVVEPPVAEVASAILATAALSIDPNAPLPEIATRKAVASPVAVAEAPKPAAVEAPVAQGAATALPADLNAPLPEIATRKAAAPKPVAGESPVVQVAPPVVSAAAVMASAEPLPEIATRKAIAPAVAVAEASKAIDAAVPVATEPPPTLVVAAGPEPSKPAPVTAAEPVVRLELLHTSAPRIRTAIPFTVKASASVKPRDKVVIGRVPAGVTFSTGRPIGPGMWQVRVVDTSVTEMVVSRSAPAEFTLTFMLLDASSMVVSGLEVAVAVQAPSIGTALQQAAGPADTGAKKSVDGKTKRGQRKTREAEVREVKPVVVQRKSVEARAPAAALRYPGDNR